MFDKNDEKIVWVSAGSVGGKGSYDKPYGSIGAALAGVHPGNTIVLKAGVYTGDLTIETSGSPQLPVRITAEINGTVEIRESCWFLYDTSDLILSNLIFRNSPHGAISVIGACKRNLFDSLEFIDCGSSQKTSCTLFFGGSDGDCNLVENCRFERDVSMEAGDTAESASIGLMIVEGDDDDALPLQHLIVRRNRFVNYAYGIIIGARDSVTGEYGHLVEYNEIDNCSAGGIIVKCGDTRIRGNLVKHCPGNSISIQAGIGSTIEDNRVIDCGSGIQILGPAHSILNNCIVRCTGPAVNVCARPGNETLSASNLFIEGNTFIDCGLALPVDKSDKRIAGIEIEPGTTSVIERNLIHGNGKPCSIHPAPKDSPKVRNGSAYYVITNNIASGNCETMQGVENSPVWFSGADSDNFENDSGYGARGWMLRPETFDPDLDVSERDYVEASVLEDDNGVPVLPEDVDREVLSSQFSAENETDMYFMGEQEEE